MATTATVAFSSSKKDPSNLWEHMTNKRLSPEEWPKQKDALLKADLSQSTRVVSAAFVDIQGLMEVREFLPAVLSVRR